RGAIGASIAYDASKTVVYITVLEKNYIAIGTSWKCDWNILAIDNDPGFYSQMSSKSQQLIHTLSKELVIPFEYRNRGSIFVSESDNEMEAAQKCVKQQQDSGLDFRMLDKEDLHNESKYFADDLYGGLECASDSTVNPYMLTYSMFHEAKKYGTKIH